VNDYPLFPENSHNEFSSDRFMFILPSAAQKLSGYSNDSLLHTTSQRSTKLSSPQAMVGRKS